MKFGDLIRTIRLRTFARWASDETRSVGKKGAKSGRMKTADEIREQALKLARETRAGYTKTLAELKNEGSITAFGT